MHFIHDVCVRVIAQCCCLTIRAWLMQRSFLGLVFVLLAKPVESVNYRAI